MEMAIETRSWGPLLSYLPPLGSSFSFSHTRATGGGGAQQQEKQHVAYTKRAKKVEEKGKGDQFPSEAINKSWTLSRLIGVNPSEYFLFSSLLSAALLFLLVVFHLETTRLEY